MFEIISFCFEAALWIRQRDDIVEFDIVEGSCLNVGFSMIAGVECKGPLFLWGLDKKPNTQLVDARIMMTFSGYTCASAF